MSRQYTSREIVQLGEEIYAREIRDQVEPEHNGEFLVLDIVTGNYTLDPDHSRAVKHAIDRHPDGVRYVKRVGYRSAHRIGNRMVR